ncbi:MAG: hypothetical protein KC501_07890 [Myxococcales bacterium]|nr:hypothetical protein [Myxococcales bacterium]
MLRRSLVALLLVACGSRTSSGDDAVASGTMTASDDGVRSCEDYDDTPEIGPAVTVTIRHEGTTPVFFAAHGCGGAVGTTVSDAGGATVPHLLDTECFPNTCAGLIDSLDCSIGCNDCAPPRAGRIGPGATTASSWSGRVLTSLSLLPECAPEGSCPSSCVRQDQAPAGSYTIGLQLWRSCTGTDDCECDGGGPPSGVCSLWGFDEQLDDPLTVSATIDYPSQTSVELVISD